jgi:hypothetical protein
MTQSSSVVEPTNPTNEADKNINSLSELVDSGANYSRISTYLDGLPPALRLEQMLAITGKRVGKLYDCVADAPAFSPADFWPEGRKDDQTVIFEGRNSLPTFSRFQKRFCRRKDTIVGYNHQTFSPVTGPGYFVVAAEDETHPGELLFDYTQEPPFKPAGWPSYKPNKSGLSRLVYFNMKDYCRRVAKNILVGAAFKGGEAQGQFFSLTLAD